MSDLTGQKFGRLILIERIVIKHKTNYKCVCDCGNEIITRSFDLKSGHSKSCGCLQIEAGFFNGLNNRVHGHSSGRKRTKEYRAWEGMKDRCLNPNYHAYDRYGGRGIKVCEKWLNSFENFLDDVGLAPNIEYSIDRIDNNGNYEPGNVRWVDDWTQAHNRG